MTTGEWQEVSRRKSRPGTAEGKAARSGDRALREGSIALRDESREGIDRQRSAVAVGATLAVARAANVKYRKRFGGFMESANSLNRSK